MGRSAGGSKNKGVEDGAVTSAVASSSGRWMMKMKGWMKHSNANSCFVDLESTKHLYGIFLTDSSPASQNMTGPIRILHRCYRVGSFIRTGHHVLIKAALCCFTTIK